MAQQIDVDVARARLDQVVGMRDEADQAVVLEDQPICSFHSVVE